MDCFIRKNSPEIRRRLEDLGYECPQFYSEEQKDRCRMTFTEDDMYFVYYMENVTKGFEDRHIDCGEDEDMFFRTLENNLN